METIIHSDGQRGYNGLVDLGDKKHFRIHHGKKGFVGGKTHINGIESFWGYAKPVWQSSAELGENRFILILRNANLDSMTGIIICTILC